MNWRTSATTWFDKLLRESNMVSTMPWIDRVGFSVERTCSTVCNNCDRPSSAKNSHCRGTRIESGGGVALGIEVDDQHALTDRSQRGAEIDRGRGLADAALLIGERQDARMACRCGGLILLINLINNGHAGLPSAIAEGLRRSIRSSSTIQPCPPVRLEWSCGRIFQYLVASVNSASTS